jgi:hypothetical protein
MLYLSCPSPAGDICIKSIFADDAIMCRTIPLYRIASERARRKWKIFRQELDKSESKIFDEMMSYSQLYNTAGVMACKSVLLQQIIMSIIFEHYKQLKKIENENFTDQ